ncbi:DUF4160 domain-containing protein [Mariniblastus sp.]|nr:DUF4160 domain-containing protein [Mariniblastus sp.]
MPEKFVDIQGNALSELRRCFKSGPLAESGGRETSKHFVGQLKGLKIEVFSEEHPPPHFRVKCGGETNSFLICDGTPMYPDGDLKKYFRNIKKWHGKNKDLLIQKWNTTRPSDCQVGEIKPSSSTKPSEIKSPKI